MSNLNIINRKIESLEKTSNIFSQPTEEEVILLHVKNMRYTWNEYDLFDEKKQFTGQEIIIPLPTNEFNCVKRLKELCDEIVYFSLDESHDYEYVIRWSEFKAEFYVIFSNRPLNNTRIPKIYSRDFWYDKKTNRQTKAHAKNAELRYKEGTFQRDQNGELRYDEPPFLKENNSFDSAEWNEELKKKVTLLFEHFLEEKEDSFLAEEEQPMFLPTEIVESNLAKEEIVKPEKKVKKTYFSKRIKNALIGFKEAWKYLWKKFLNVSRRIFKFIKEKLSDSIIIRKLINFIN